MNDEQPDQSTVESDRDEVVIRLKRNVPQPVRQDYVVSAAAGLFKRGKHYAPGDVIQLDTKTAERFMEVGDIDA